MLDSVNKNEKKPLENKQVFSYSDFNKQKKSWLSEDNDRFFMFKKKLNGRTFSIRRKIKIFLKDHYNLLFKSAADNHMRIQRMIKNPDGTVEVSMIFESYTALKKYQKRLRRVTLSASASISLMLIISLITQLILPVFKSHAGTYYWDQTSWDIAATPTVYAKHMQDWTKYESKDANIAIANPAPADSQIKLSTAPVTTSAVQTSDTDFKNGNPVFTQTGVGSSGDSAYVFPCQFDHGGQNWEPTNGDAWDTNGATDGSIEITGTHCNISNFTIASGKTVYVKAFDGTNYGTVRIYAQNSTITGTLSANEKGYAGGVGSQAGQGPGAGQYSTVWSRASGAAHGGNGGYGNSSAEASQVPGGLAYGSLSSPTELGSGGGGFGSNGGNGGGAIRLNIAGTLTVNGSLQANGNTVSVSAGGGAGGSIYLTVGTIVGTTGVLAVKGGGSSYYSGGGGGGRIAIEYGNSSYAGSYQISGGWGGGTQNGGSGTVYLKKTGQTNYDLQLDNSGTLGASTPLFIGQSQDTTIDQLKITGKAVLTNFNNLNITTSINGNSGGPDYTLVNGSLLSNTGTYSFPNGNQFNNLTLDNFTLRINTLSANNQITVKSGSVITSTQLSILQITTPNLDVQSGGVIQVNEKGYSGGTINKDGQGPGAGKSFSGYGSGAGYGGIGGLGGWSTTIVNGGSAYGSMSSPTDFGSGGAGDNTSIGSNGGGAMRLNISGTLTVNGSIQANGKEYTNASVAGGGSGGSIYLTVGTFTGGASGVIAVNGGMSKNYNGHGGGGRIAIEYSSSTYAGAYQTQSFGNTDLKGGSGTVYLKKTGQTNYDLQIDNGGSYAGASTPLFIGQPQDTTIDNLKIVGKATLANFNSLNITTSINGNTGPDFTLDNGSLLSNTGTYTFPNSNQINNLTLDNFTLQINNLSASNQITVKTGGVITSTQLSTLQITALNLDVQAGGIVQVDGKGYAGGAINQNGQGGGGGKIYSGYGGGGGYGGAGGFSSGSTTTGGATYGSAIAPTDFGSGGAGSGTSVGGNGGGVLRLNVSGTLTINGSVQANGSDGKAGAGSGGSVYISAGTFAGSGTLAAKGGNSNVWGHGGGGGGRIAVEYVTKTFSSAYQLNGGISYNNGSGTGTKAENGVLVYDPQAQTYAFINEKTGEKTPEFKSLRALANYVLGIPTAKAATAEYVSGTIDLRYQTEYQATSLDTLNINADPGITIQLATKDNDDSNLNNWNFAGNYSPGSNVAINNLALNNHRYLKYKATFTYNDGAEPHFNDVSINYTGQRYPVSQALVSSWFDSTNDANALTKILWSEDATLPAATNVKFQIRTAPSLDAGVVGDPSDDTPQLNFNNDELVGGHEPDGLDNGQRDFVGPDGTNNSFFTSEDSARCNKNGQQVSCNIPGSYWIGDAQKDQWLQYKMFLGSSGGANTPQIDSVKIEYVMNGSPVISNVSAYQDTDGLLKISYKTNDDNPNGLLDIFFGADTGVKVAALMDVNANTININNGSYESFPVGAFIVQVDEEQMNVSRNAGSSTLNIIQRAINNTRLSSHLAGKTVWFIGSQTSGAGLDIVKPDADATRTGIWDIAKDLNASGVYLANSLRIRVIANDGSFANQVSLEDGALANSITLDTTSPAVNPTQALRIDARKVGTMESDQAKITIKANDNSDLYFRYSLVNEMQQEPLNNKMILKGDTKNSDSGQWILANEAKGAGFEKIVSLAPDDISRKQDTVYVQFKDKYYNVSEVYAVSTPERPSGEMIQDITNTRTTPNDYGLFVAWKKPDAPAGNLAGQFGHYVVEKALITNPSTNQQPINSDFSQLEIINDKAKNNYTDMNVVYNDTLKNNYFYRMYTVDGAGNISYYSATQNDENKVLQGIPNGTQDPSEGGGGVSDSSLKANIDNINATVNSHGATIIWQTDQASDSIVDYSTSSDLSNAVSVGSPSFVDIGNLHSVVLDGLASDKTYYYRVKSTNAAGIESMKDAGFSLHTLSGVKIDPNSILTSNVQNDTVTISWLTDKSSDSFVSYAELKDPENINDLKDAKKVGTEKLVSEKNLDGKYIHSVEITGLKENTQYFYSVKSTDVDGVSDENRNTVNAQNEFYTFTTTFDNIAPQISGLGVLLQTYDKAVISWLSDEDSHGILHYRLKDSADPYLEKTMNDVEYSKKGVLVLDGLQAGKEYEYYLSATDINGNAVIKKDGINNDTPWIFKTKVVVTDGILNDPGDLNVLQVTENDAVAAFGNATSTYAISKLCYDTAPISDDAINEINGQSCVHVIDTNTPTKTHFYHLQQLLSGTRYYLKVKIASAEDANNVFYKTVELVTPVQVLRIALVCPEGNLVAAQYSDTEAMLTLDKATNATSVSKICYDTNPISDDAINGINGQICSNSMEISTPTRTHLYHLVNLSANQTYYAKIKITDEINADLNFILPEAQFTTLELQQGHPDLIAPGSDPVIEQISDTEAMVILPEVVNTLSTSKLCTAKDVISDVDTCAGGQLQTITNATRTHAYHVSNLDAKTTYHFRMKITDSLKPEINFTLNDITTQTLAKQVPHLELVASAPPQVLQKSDKEVVIMLGTNTDAWSKIWYAKDQIITEEEIAICENSKDACKYSLLEISDKTRNHTFHLASLEPRSAYHFRIKTIDSEDQSKTFVSDDMSFQSLERQVDHLLAESGVANTMFVNNNQAIITWRSLGKNEQNLLLPTTSVAKICFNENSISDGEMANCTNQIESNTGATTHIFNLENLKADTTYHYRFLTTDSEDNSKTFLSTDFAFQTSQALDTEAPQLADVEPVTILDTQAQSATVQIIAKEDAIAFIQYLDTKNNFVADSLEKSDSKQYVKNHIITLTNLKQTSDRYFFKVKLQDAKGNTASYPLNADQYYEFSTVKGPVIDQINCVPGKNNLVISWRTDEDADSTLLYGVTEDFAGAYRKSTDTKQQDHNMVADGLFPITPYYFKVISQNTKGGVSQSDVKKCTTLDGVVDQKAPSISNVQAVFIAKNQALINWTTDIPATSQVALQKTDSKPSSYNILGQINNDMQTSHNYLVTGLDADSPYHYQVISRNSIGIEERSDDYDFRTLKENTSENTLNDVLNGTYNPPLISSTNAAISQVSGTTVTITWKTDKLANSTVSFKAEGASDYSEQGNTTELVNDHSVTLTNLAPNTQYTYFVKSVDVIGNMGQSNVSTFTTAPASAIFNVQIVDIAYDSATVTWETSVDTTTQLEYGEKGEYNEVSGVDKNYSKAHTVSLTNLASGVTYNVRLKNQDKLENMYTSSEYTFKTPSPPEIADFKLDSLTENKIRVSFKTNIETVAFVTLTNVNDPNDIHTQGDPAMATQHSIEVGGLDSGYSYGLKISIKDSKGNGVEKAIDDFTTDKDSNPPKIDNIKSDSALTQNDKVQTIFSWVTDEPTNGYIVYSEGRSGKKTTIKVDDSFFLKHVFVTTSLKPGTAYYFNINSSDKSGNSSSSSDYALLTPKQKQNIVQIILGNFMDIFSWTNFKK